MRGRGRGRGRGGFGGGFSAEKHPLRPIDTFIYNPNCEEPPTLTDEDRKLIVFNRYLKRYWNESEFYVHDGPSERIMENYYDQFEPDIRDPDVQKRTIVDGIGPEYFPSELLVKSFNRRAKQRLGASKKAFNWADLEKKEKTGGETEGGGNEDLGEEAELNDEGSDFGGEDYGVDHAMDEDREDDFLDGGELGEE